MVNRFLLGTLVMGCFFGVVAGCEETEKPSEIENNNLDQLSLAAPLRAKDEKKGADGFKKKNGERGGDGEKGNLVQDGGNGGDGGNSDWGMAEMLSELSI